MIIPVRKYWPLLLTLFVLSPAHAGPAETALNWVLGQVDEVLPGSLTYDELQASFTGPVILTGVRYEDGPLLVAVDRFELAVDISVFSRAVTINRLQAFDVEVRLPPPAPGEPAPSEEPFALNDVSLPVSLDIQQVAVRNLSILPYGADEPVQIDQINLSARTEEDTVVVDTAEVVMPQGRATLSGTLTPVGQYPVDLNLVWDWEIPGAGSYSGRGSVSGDLARLRTTQVVSGALRGELRATVSDALTAPAWEAQLNALVPDLGVYQADYRGRELNLQVQTRGSLDDYQASGSLTTGALPEVGEVEAVFDLAGTDESLQVSELRLSASESPLQLGARADIDLQRQVLNARGQWQDLVWPLTGDPQVASPTGEFVLDGTLDDFEFNLDTRVRGEQFGSLRIVGSGEGDTQRVRLSSLRVAALDGPLAVELLGVVGLQDLQFDLQGRWQDIAIPLTGPPQVRIPSGTVQASGTPEDYRLSLNTALLGEAFGELEASLRASGDQQAVVVERLTVSRPDGDLGVQLDGRYELAGQQFQVEARIEALPLPLTGEPAVTVPGATLTASGTPADYQARLETTLRGEALGELQTLVEARGDARTLQLENLRLTRPGSDLAVSLSGSYVLLDQRFDLDGTLNALPVPLAGEPALTIPTGEISASGTPEDYQADLAVNLQGEAFGELSAALMARGDTESVVLEALRLGREGTDLAVALDGRFGFAEQRFQVSGTIESLPIPLTGEPALTIPSGELSASGTPGDYQARLRADLSGEATGELIASLAARGDTQAVVLESLTLTRADSDLMVGLEGRFGFAEQRFQVAGEIDALPVPLSGEPALTVSDGELAASGTPGDYQASLEAALSGAQFGTLNASLRAAGDTEQVRIIELTLREPDGEFMLGGEASLTLADTRFQADLGWQGLRWPLVGDPQLISPDGQVTASGTPTDYQASIDATLLGPEDQPLSAELALSGTDQRIEISTLQLTSPGDGPSLSASATVALQPLNLDASGRWQNLVWPLAGEPQVRIPTGEFQASGDADAYTFALDTRVAGPALPATALSLSGRGSINALEQATLQAELLGGTVNADLAARWQPALGWEATLTGENLAIGEFAPEFPGSVGFAATSEGRTEDGTLNARVAIQGLDGSLRGQALDGSGTVTVRGDTVIVDDLNLTAGQANLRVDGRVAEELALDWRLNARLGPLLPDFQGQIQGQGSLAGSREAPRAVADLTVNNLAGAGVAVDALDLDATVDLGADARSTVDLQGRGIQAGGQIIETLSLKGAGTPGSHRVNLTARTGEFGALQLALAGGLGEENVWRGDLETLQLTDTPAGDWRLASQAPLQAGAEAASLGTACLVQSPAEICLEGNWSATEGARVQVALDDLTPALAGERLPENLTVDTSLGGEIIATTDPAGGFTATADLALAPGRVVTEVNGNPVEIPLAGGGLELEANNQRADAQLAVDLGRLGNLAATATVLDLATRPRVEGNLEAVLNDLTLAETLVPQLTDVDGRIVADLTVSGTPPVLDLGGSLALRDAGAEVPEINIQLEDLNLEAAGVGAENLALDGSVRSGEGTLRFGGELAPLEGRVTLTIQGDRFQVINTDDIQALASPDLRVSVSPEEVRVTGEVLIPQAFISPPELQESGIRPSGDVVIVRDRSGAVVETGAGGGAPIFARVRVILGDEVYLSAVGFEGKLEGSLEVEQRPGLAVRGTGSIQVARGQYRIAGQEIDIERGRILFGGGPITQPGLDLRVARSEDGVTAGATVTGPVTEPKLSFFSSPSMPDSSILSYLVFGRPPDSRASGENALLLSAVTGGSSLLTQRVGEQVGLDDLRIVGDGTDQASLLVGKYLTPDLWVGYGVGLLNAVNEFLVRYNLTENIDLEAATSERGTGADITYTIER